MGQKPLNSELIVILTGTVLLAATHTISPDHWFPFVMIGRANKWSIPHILLLATLAGIGHVGTSVVIGMMGVFASKELSEYYANIAENATCILLMVFGFGYAIWSWKRGGHHHGIPFLARKHDHKYLHYHDDRDHEHHEYENFDMDRHMMEGHAEHRHGQSGQQPADLDHLPPPDNLHLRQRSFHDRVKDRKAGYGLVAIIGLTPCVALLPLTFAATPFGLSSVVLVNITFAVCTLGTMLLLTTVASLGVAWIRMSFFDKHGDVIAGVVIGCLGIMTMVFGI
jgi:hypothetical protein